MLSSHYPFKFPPLPYAYDALEPYIDEETMRIHHDIMFKKYVDNLNAILKANPTYQDWSLYDLLAYNEDFGPEIGTAIRNNGGGALNHYLYFDGMTPEHTEPTGSLKTAIERDFGSTDNLFRNMKTAALSQFGSGYAWLMFDGVSKLRIVKAANQNPPPLQILQPIFLVDVWEHAYFLKYTHERDRYFDAWCNLIDWNKAGERFPAG